VLPEIPAPLRADVHGARVKLTWPPAHDAETHIVKVTLILVLDPVTRVNVVDSVTFTPKWSA